MNAPLESTFVICVCFKLLHGVVCGPAYNSNILMQKNFNEMTKEEMKERERDMKKKLMKETRELDREIYKVESMKKQAEDKLKKEIAKGILLIYPRRQGRYLLEEDLRPTDAPVPEEH